MLTGTVVGSQFRSGIDYIGPPAGFRMTPSKEIQRLNGDLQETPVEGSENDGMSGAIWRYRCSGACALDVPFQVWL